MAKDRRAKALAQHLGCDVSEVSAIPHAHAVHEYKAEGKEFLVLTDREATKRTVEYIKDSVWTFNASFVASHSKLPYDDTLEIVKALQHKCEDANEAMTGLIKNMKKFVADAISADGRGHFISSYDGNEDEERVGKTYFYIYRTN